MIEAGCEITDTIIMGSDYYNKQEVSRKGKVTETPLFIGENTKIHKAIIDKNACIGKNVVIHPGDRINEDNEWCYIRDGIIVVPKGKNIPDGTVV